MSSNNRYNTAHLVILCLVLFLGGIFPDDSARAQDTNTAKLVEGAKKEGKMVFYSSLNVEDNNGLLKTV